jgi:uncharacterized delta-60 repeat protein
MKKIIYLFFILFLSHCGIDKESSSVPQSSVSNLGELDSTFNSGGILTIHNSALGNGADEIYSTARDSQDRIIGVGLSDGISGQPDLAVWRLNSDGSFDSSFAVGGVFTHNNAAGGNGADIGYSVVLNSADEIFITGTSLNGSGNFDMIIWKLTTSGTLDTTFNGSGIFVHDNAAGGNLNDQGNDIALDGNGKIIVVGFSDQTITNRDMAIWKLNANGTLDTSFDADGFVTEDGTLSGEDDVANALVIDAANNIFVTGQADTPANSGDMIVWKFNSTGLIDTTFNGTGFFSLNGTAGGSNLDAGIDLTLDSSGSLYVTGYSKNALGNNDMVTWKILATGSLDLNFNGIGYVVFDVSNIFGGTTNDTGESILIDSIGRILVVGSGNEDLCVWRFNTDGSLDTTFNTDGFFSHDSAAGGFGIDSGTSVSEDSENRIYIGGFSRNSSGNNDATFWRLK